MVQKIHDNEKYEELVKNTSIYKCTFCDYEIGTYKNFKRHIVSKHVNADINLYYKYGCTQPNSTGKNCLHYTDDISKYKRHMGKTGLHDNPKTFICTICNSAFFTNDNLVEHMQTHSEEQHTCYECQSVYTTSNSLRNHVRICHEELARIYTCKHCESEFDAKHKHDHHVQKQHKVYICFVCNQDCGYNSNLNRHLRDVHKLEMFSCVFADCNTTFSKKNELNQHVQDVHKPHEQLVFCGLCKYVIDTQERLDLHIYYCHPTEKKRYPCIYEYCDYIGENPSRTKRHIQTKHSLERPFYCDTCEATFNLKEDLKQHQVIHSNETPFHCDMCDYKTKIMSRLTSHKYWHNKVYKYKCHLCSHSYCNNAGLSRHVEMKHSPEYILNIKKQKEHQVYLYLTESGLDLKLNLTINLYSFFKEPCLYVDFHFEYNGIYFLLEVDEEMHSMYGVECDSNRMHKICNYLFLTNEQRPVVFLRYNPDNFKLDGVKQTKESYPRKNRMKELYNFVTGYTTTAQYSIKYFFYDSQDETTLITEHPDYNQHMKQYVI